MSYMAIQENGTAVRERACPRALKRDVPSMFGKLQRGQNGRSMLSKGRTVLNEVGRPPGTSPGRA